MEINNFSILSKYFKKLKSTEDFYFIQIIQRKKDGHFKNENVIKSLYIYNEEEFLHKEEYIIQICKKYNARAYFWIIPRNSKIITLECIKALSDSIISNSCKHGYKIWDKKCGSTTAPNYKHHWIVDIDNKDKGFLITIGRLINLCRGNDDNKIIDIIPTLNGYHLITSEFDLYQFKQKLALEGIVNIDVHKNNPTLLYYEKAEL